MNPLANFHPHGRITRAFDPHTGQVFVESVVPLGRAPGVPNGNIRQPRPGNEFGARSLEYYAMNSILRNMSSIDVEDFKVLAMTPHLLDKLWNLARFQYPDLLLAVWKLVVQASPKDPSWQHLHQTSFDHHRDFVCDLSAWMPQLSSPTCAWLTALTISNVDCSRQDLIDLYKLKNLVSLDICGNRSANDLRQHSSGAFGRNISFVDERLLWHWSNHACHDDAFKELRVLIIRKEPRLDHNISAFLSGLPSLVLFGAQDCNIDAGRDRKPFMDNGFAPAELDQSCGVDLTQLNHEIALDKYWHGVLRICTHRTEPYRSTKPEISLKTGGPYKPGDFGDAPLLNFRIGGTPSGTIFSKPIQFFTNSRALRHATPRPSWARPSRDWVFVPQGYRSADANACRPPIIMAPPVQPDNFAKNQRAIRANARVDLKAFFDMNGLGTSVGNMKVGMERSKSSADAAAATDVEDDGSPVLRHKKGRHSELPTGCVSTPGTPPRDAGQGPSSSSDGEASSQKARDAMKMLVESSKRLEDARAARLAAGGRD